MGKEFTKRQAAGIDRFFQAIHVPEDERDANLLTLVETEDLGEPEGDCEVCGHGGLRYLFHLAHKDDQGGPTLIAGSKCIQTFLSANEYLVRSVEEEQRRLIKQARKDRYQAIKREKKEKDAKDLQVAYEMIKDLAEKTDSEESVVLGMLKECIDHGYPFTEKRREWARGRVRRLRTIQSN